MSHMVVILNNRLRLDIVPIDSMTNWWPLSHQDVWRQLEWAEHSELINNSILQAKAQFPGKYGIVGLSFAESHEQYPPE